MEWDDANKDASPMPVRPGHCISHYYPDPRVVAANARRQELQKKIKSIRLKMAHEDMASEQRRVESQLSALLYRIGATPSSEKDRSHEIISRTLEDLRAENSSMRAAVEELVRRGGYGRSEEEPPDAARRLPPIRSAARAPALTRAVDEYPPRLSGVEPVADKVPIPVRPSSGRGPAVSEAETNSSHSSRRSLADKGMAGLSKHEREEKGLAQITPSTSAELPLPRPAGAVGSKATGVAAFDSLLDAADTNDDDETALAKEAKRDSQVAGKGKSKKGQATAGRPAAVASGSERHRRIRLRWLKPYLVLVALRRMKKLRQQHEVAVNDESNKFLGELNEYREVVRSWLIRTLRVSVSSLGTPKLDLSLQSQGASALPLAFSFSRSKVKSKEDPTVIAGRVVKVRVRVKGILDELDKALSSTYASSTAATRGALQSLVNIASSVVKDGNALPANFLWKSEFAHVQLTSLKQTKDMMGAGPGGDSDGARCFLLGFVIGRILIPLLLQPSSTGLTKSDSQATQNGLVIGTVLYLVLRRLYPGIGLVSEEVAMLTKRELATLSPGQAIGAPLFPSIKPIATAVGVVTKVESGGLASTDLDRDLASLTRWPTEEEVSARLLPRSVFESVESQFAEEWWVEMASRLKKWVDTLIAMAVKKPTGLAATKGESVGVEDSK